MDVLTTTWLGYMYGAAGLLLGSFLNVVGFRMPRSESIVFPGSYCPACKTSLKPFELIPVLSWFILRGRCRYCRRNISLRYPVIELTTACLFVLTVMHFTIWWVQLVWCLFWLFIVAVMVTDMTAMKVPNVISYPGALIMFVLSVLSGVQTAFHAVLGMIVCSGVLLLVRVLSGGKMGLGDVKLYLSIGAMLGPWFGLLSFVLACTFGCAVGLFMRVLGLLQKGDLIPFVPYISMGVIVTVFAGHEFVSWYMQWVLGFG